MSSFRAFVKGLTSAEVRWRLAPGDEDFLTQTLQVHLVRLPPHGCDQGHRQPGRRVAEPARG
jgi:hypothetical protein